MSCTDSTMSGAGSGLALKAMANRRASCSWEAGEPERPMVTVALPPLIGSITTGATMNRPSSTIASLRLTSRSVRSPN